MVELAVDIVAFCIVVAAAVTAWGILGAIGLRIGEWMDAGPRRRRRFWWTVGAAIGAPVLLIWYADSPAGLAAAVGMVAAIGAMIGLAVGILLIKDRWPVVGVVLTWVTWWGFLLGVLAVVLVREGRLL